MMRQLGSLLYKYTVLLVVQAFLTATGAAAQDSIPIEVVPQFSASGGSAAMSWDGRQLITSSGGGTLKLWDMASGRLLRTFVGHEDTASAVAFSPDGSFVVSSGYDKNVKLWDTKTGRLVQTFTGHLASVNAVAFSPDGKQLLSGSIDTTMKYWSVATGRLLHDFTGNTSPVNAVGFSPDGQFLVSGSPTRLWKASTGEPVRQLQASGGINSVAFSPDSRQIVGAYGRNLLLWDTMTGKLLRTIKMPASHDDIRTLAFSPDGRYVATGGIGMTSAIWDLASGATLRTFKGHTNHVEAVAFTSDGRHLLSSSSDGTVKLWDTASGKLEPTFQNSVTSTGVASLEYSNNATQVLVGHRDGRLLLWDISSGRLVRTLRGHSRDISAVKFLASGREAISASWDGALIHWNLKTGQPIRTFNTGLPLKSVALLSDDLDFVAGDDGGKLKFWNIATGKVFHTISGHTGNSTVSDLTLSPDGQMVASSSWDQTIKIWSKATKRIQRTLRGHSGLIYSVKFSPDGSQIISGSSDKSLKLWSAKTGELLKTLEGHLGSVNSVSFSPDGRYALSGSSDRTVRLWDLERGTSTKTFEGHFESVESVSFLSKGHRAASGSSDGTVRYWDVESGKLLASMFSDRDGRWTAMTADGFFDSDGKDNWGLNIVRGVEVTALDQVRQSLYSPDLVREALAGDPSGEVRDAAKVMNLANVIDSGPSPTVTITSHATASHSDNDLVALQARISDYGKGIGRIEWRVNGITAGVVGKPEGVGPEYTVTRQIALDAGKNEIEVVAYNGSNLLASLPARATVTYTGSADSAKPRLHVLAIGIDKYADPGIEGHKGFGPLKLAVKDAEVIAAELKRAAAGHYVGEPNIQVLRDGEAAREKIAAAIDRMAEDIHPRDTFILFAAGHGVSRDGRFYLIPQDYIGGDHRTLLRRHAIGQDMLQDWLANRIKAKRAVVLLDTCESGAVVAGYLRARSDAAASEAGVGRLHEATGRPVLTAAATGQFAFEGLIRDGSGKAEVRHGVFTWALLDALRNGDTNNDGAISLSELVAHVQTIVPQVAARFGGKAEGRGAGGAALAEPSKDLKRAQSARFGSRGEDFVIARALR